MKGSESHLAVLLIGELQDLIGSILPRLRAMRRLPSFQWQRA
jgi:hypothetical protein